MFSRKYNYPQIKNLSTTIYDSENIPNSNYIPSKMYLAKQISKRMVFCRRQGLLKEILSSKIRHLHTHAKWWSDYDMRSKHENSIAPHLWSCA